MDNQKKDYYWFLENLENFRTVYSDKPFLVISCKKVIGSYETFEKALKKTLKEHEMGTFIIQDIKNKSINIY
jgi:hypothetical protein